MVGAWCFGCLSVCLFVCLFCCFTSQVNSYGHCGTVSSPNHTFFWASLNKQLTSNRAHTFACNWQQPFMNDSAEGRRMTVEIISWSISTKVWNRAGIELATPGSAVSFASVTKHVTDCATRPGGCLSGPPGFTCCISFAPVFSFIYCWVLIFALSPCYILIYMF